MKANSILRKPLAFEGRFTQLPNNWARDNRISFRAKGILLQLMSHQSGWATSMEHLANEGPEGVTAIRSAVLELEDAGYLFRELIKDEVTQQFKGSVWIIVDPFENPSLGFPTSANPTTEKPTSEKRALKNNNIKEYKDKNISDDFERFWKIYPRKVGGKSAALKSFIKALEQVTAEQILTAAEEYANRPNLPEMQYIPHPTTWLNQGRWADDLSTETKNTPTSIAEDIIIRSRQLAERTDDIE